MKTWVALLCFCLWPLGAFAQEAWYVYPYETPEQGANEFQLRTQKTLASDWVTRFDHRPADWDRVTMEELEWEHGLTPQFAMAGYVNFASIPGETAVSGYRIEAQYKFGNPGDHFMDTALNFEYSVPRKGFLDEPENFEARLILDKVLGDFEIRLNEVSEKELVGRNPEGLTVGTSSGVYWRRYEIFQAGVEYHGRYGALSDPDSWPNAEQVALLVVDSNFARDYSLRLAGGPGLTGGSDRWVAQLFLTYEPAPRVRLGVARR